MVVIAALVGAGGLGVPVVRALNTVQIGMGFEAGIAIVLLAMILDRVMRPPSAVGPLMSAALEFRHVDILFPAQGGRGQREAMRRALELLDGGAPRMQIAERTGIVVGVADASLSVEPGEISVLMGLSGSGKSTLLRAANGLNTVTRGQVLVGGASGEVVDVAACDRARLREVRRQRIAMVFQQFGLLPWRTVRENVGLGLELRGDLAGRAAADRG